MNPREVIWCNDCAVKDERIDELQRELEQLGEEQGHATQILWGRLCDVYESLEAVVDGDIRILQLVVKGILAEERQKENS